MQKKLIKEIFHLEGYIFDKFEEQDDKIILHCHIQSNIMVSERKRTRVINQVRTRLIAHSMFENKKVFISVKQRRFYFSKHKKLWEPLPQVKRGQQMSVFFKKKHF